MNFYTKLISKNLIYRREKAWRVVSVEILCQLLHSCTKNCIDPPLHWSGSNSEWESEPVVCSCVPTFSLVDLYLWKNC